MHIPIPKVSPEHKQKILDLGMEFIPQFFALKEEIDKWRKDQPEPHYVYEATYHKYGERMKPPASGFKLIRSEMREDCVLAMWNKFVDGKEPDLKVAR